MKQNHGHRRIRKHGGTKKSLISSKATIPNGEGDKEIRVDLGPIRTALSDLLAKILSEHSSAKIDLPDSALEAAIKTVLRTASHWRHPDAEDAAMRGFYKGLESFDPWRVILTAFGYWVGKKVECELRNLLALNKRSVVLDAFERFFEKCGYYPSVQELAKFARLNPRLIINVFVEMQKENNLPPRTEGSLRDIVGAASTAAWTGEPP